MFMTLDWGGKLVFYNCIVGGAIDARFLPSILKGVMKKCTMGRLPVHMHGDITCMCVWRKMHLSTAMIFHLKSQDYRRFARHSSRLIRKFWNLFIRSKYFAPMILRVQWWVICKAAVRLLRNRYGRKFSESDRQSCRWLEMDGYSIFITFHYTGVQNSKAGFMNMPRAVWSAAQADRWI